MTLTKHGHHIPGTTDEGEDPNARRARCGGCQICPECYWEWRKRKKNEHHEEKGISMPGMTMGASSNGSGKLTVAMLKELIAELPEEAHLTIQAGNGQRDGDYWSIRAEWGESRSTNPRGTKRTNFNAPPITDSVSRAASAQGEGYVGPYGDGVGFPGDH